MKFLSILAILPLFFLTSCSLDDFTQDLRDPNSEASLIVSTGTDIALSLALSENPEFSPYASIVSELVRTRDLTPDAFDTVLDTFLADEVDEEDRIYVGPILAILKDRYRDLRTRRKIEVEPESYLDSLADQLVAGGEGGSK